MVVANLMSQIEAILNVKKNKILTFAQLALPDSQFKVFRKLLLDEMGANGLEADLKNLLDKQHGTERNGRE